MQGIDPELALRIVREEREIVAYDTETTGLEFADTPVGYVITNREHSLYVPTAHLGGGNIAMAEDFEKELAAAFADRARLGYRTVGHNLGFDLRMSLKRGIVLGGLLEDTQINEALIFDRTIGYGLDDLSGRYGVTVKKGAELYAELASRFGGLPDRKAMQHFAKMPGDHPLVVDYTVGDGVSTIEVWEKQQPLLDEGELRKPWLLECALLPYIARLHHRGIKVDPVCAEKVMEDIAKGLKVAASKFEPGFNSRAPTEVEKLYRANGYTDEMFARTASGKVSFTEKFLKTNEIGEAILDMRRLEKARDSFVTPLIDTHNHGGRVHAVLNQSKSDEFGVAGARLSCSMPNLQAFPKRNKVVGKIVRPLLVADDDMDFAEADASQQEPRLFTHYSQEPSLVQGYRDGTADMHDRASEFLSLERDVAKRLGLGMLTMMSPKTLAMHMDWPVEKAAKAHAAFLTDAFPKIGAFQQLAVRIFKQRGFVKSILGRRAYMESARFAYQAVSRIIQNGGGDHMKTCILRACQYEDTLPPGTIEVLLSIHDSLIFQSKKGARKEVRELLRILDAVPHEPDFNLSVPIPFELQMGENWGAASYSPIKLKAVKGWHESWKEAA